MAVIRCLRLELHFMEWWSRIVVVTLQDIARTMKLELAGR